MLESDITAYLAAQGVGTEGTDLFYKNLPDDESGTYDNAVLVTRRGTGEPVHEHGGATSDDCGLLVTVRNTSVANGWAKTASVITALSGLSGTSLSSTHYYGILQTGSVITNTDENNRDIWIVAFSAVKDR